MVNIAMRENIKRAFLLFLCVTMLLTFDGIAVGAEKQNETEIPKEAVFAALYEADISSIRLAITEGLVTSKELTQYYLDRIEQYDEPFNCFITILEVHT